MGKHVICPVCKTEHYATFAKCPSCIAAAPTLNAQEETEGLAETGESPVYDPSGEGHSLAHGSGSGKYDALGMTDWTGEGCPDYERR